jgi:uncharacterized protein YfaS (alpha-2-macroglobulin family)
MKYKKLFLILLLFLLSIFPLLSEENPEYYLNLFTSDSTYLSGEKIYLRIHAQTNKKFDKEFKEKAEIFLYSLKEDEIENLDTEYVKKIFGKKTPFRKWIEELTFEPSHLSWSYAEKETEFSLKEQGYYLIAGKLENAISYFTINVSEIGVITKSSQDKILVFVSGLEKGQPIPSASVSLYSEKKEIASLLTDKDGIAIITNETVDLDLSKYKNLLIKVKKGKSFALLKIDNIREDYREFKAYIYTDRPIYRPSQVVYFKGILRIKEKDKLNPIQNEEIDVSIRDSKSEEIYKKKLKTNLYGSISDSLILKDEIPLGTYTIFLKYKNYEQYGYFKVEEYRKPEYEIRISSDKKIYFQGEEINFKILAKYYFGAPVSFTKFSYEIYKSYYYPYYYYEWWEEDEISKRYPRYGNILKTGEGKTDKDGFAIIKFIAEKIDYDATYSIVVKMTDLSRREVTGSHTIKVTKSSFYLTVNTEKYIYTPDEIVRFKIKAVDYEENPKSVLVFLKVRKYLYDKDGKSQKEDVLSEKLKTDEKGIAYYEFIPDSEGYFEVEVESFDERENKVNSFAYFYSTKSHRYNWYSSSSLEIILDKKSYEVGEKAKIILNCPYKDASALFTVEGEEIYFEKIFNFKDNFQLIELEIKKEYPPNVFLNLCLYYGKNFYQINKKLVVPAKENFLNLKLTSNKSEYKPREILKYNIKVEDNKKNPVSAELSLGIVDESIYAIAKDETLNIQKFFYGERYNKIITNNSLFYYNRYEEKLKAPFVGKAFVLKSEISEESGYAQPEFIRSYFLDTCYFNPTIITDENGCAVVNVQLPDNLTTWRATAKALTYDTKVGEAQDKIVVKKELLVRLETPRFIRERDKLKISGIVHNYLNKDKEVLVKLKTEGVKLKSESSKKIFVPKNEAKRVDFEISSENPGFALFNLTALSDEASDALEIKIPVLPHGTEKFSSFANVLEKISSEEILLPDNVNKKSAYLKIILSPSLASSILSSLEYLAGYPYGCVEQTMSRFLPTVIVAKTLQELDIYNEKLQKELPSMVEKGLERLYDFQHSDGGWGWWKNDSSHPFMTAYVVYGLNLTKKAGFKIDENRIMKGIEHLKKIFNSEKLKNDLNAKAYILFVLSELNQIDKKDAISIYKKKDKLNNYTKALLCLTLKKLKLEDEALNLISTIEKKAETTATISFWSPDESSFGWTRSDIETTAYCLKALINIKPESKLIPKVVRYLTLSKRGNSYFSTKDTSAALLALIDYLKISSELSPDFTLKVYLNEKFLKQLKFTKEDLGKESQEIFISGENLNFGKNKIKFEKQGEGKLYYSIYLKYYTNEEGIKSENSGIKIERRYSNSSLKSADIINVTLNIISDNDYEYVIIEDPLPAGCEVADEIQKGYYWNYWFSQREVRDEKVVYFITYLPKGKHKLNYILRSETPGKYHTMPTKAYLMYIPEIGGTGSENIIEIRD